MEQSPETTRPRETMFLATTLLLLAAPVTPQEPDVLYPYKLEVGQVGKFFEKPGYPYRFVVVRVLAKDQVVLLPYIDYKGKTTFPRLLVVGVNTDKMADGQSVGLPQHFEVTSPTETKGDGRLLTLRFRTPEEVREILKKRK